MWYRNLVYNNARKKKTMKSQDGDDPEDHREEEDTAPVTCLAKPKRW